MYLSNNQELTTKKRDEEALNFISDIKRPVPYSEDIKTVFTPRKYMTDDQRFAARRPDVLVFETDLLTEDLTLSGDILAKLKVATTGTAADWIVKKVSTLKTKNTVTVESEKTHDHIAKEMQKADVFVLFSNIENLPLVLIESISSGTPFIATKVGGIPELFNNELGRLVDAGNIDQLLNEMNFMVENPNFFNSSIIRSYATKNYSNEEVGKKFNDLYIENCN